MLIELGNHSSRAKGLDERPKVTEIWVPEFDDGSLHPEGRKLGGYTHEVGKLDQDTLRNAYLALVQGQGVTRAEDSLPDHEAILTVISQWDAAGIGSPAWVKVHPSQAKVEQVRNEQGEVIHPGVAAHGEDAAQEIESLLRDFWRVDAEKPVDIEGSHWTKNGAPGQYPGDPRPDVQAVYVNDGRVLNNNNDGGGVAGVVGTATGATATTLTGLSSYAGPGAGYRVYVMQTATGPIIWGNIVAVTGTTITVDRWYSAATPGGAAPSAPSAGFYYIVPDGGAVSSWFQGLDTSGTAPAATDTAAGAEYSTSAGGLYRKQATVGSTSGVATRQVVLTVTYTVTGSDSGLPVTTNSLVICTGMVPGAAKTLKFHPGSGQGFTAATVSATGDQLSTTFTLNGS